MIARSRKATINWKSDSSYFRKRNEHNIDEPRRYLGSSVTAVKEMTVRGDMLRVLMPPILGLDPNSTDSNWTKVVKNYWDSLIVIIPPGGKELELGFQYDIQLDKPDLKEIISKKKITTDEQLANWVEGSTGGEPNVKEEDKYRYATPIVPEDYMLWVYTWNYRDVANNPADVDKSAYIRFYIMFDGDLERIKRDAYIKKQDAEDKFMLVRKDNDLVDNMIYLFDRDPKEFGDTIDKHIFLKEKSQTNPDEFVAIASDKSLTTKALLERMIRAGVLNRLVNTQIIVDSTDPEFVVGNSLPEAVIFFNSDATTKVAKVKEFKTKLNSLTSK